MVLNVVTASSLMAAPKPSNGLPDAPAPAADVALPDAPMPQTTPSSSGTIHYASHYMSTIFPGETVRRLTARQKFIYAGRQMVEPLSQLSALRSAVWGQWVNSNPLYGTNSTAFAQRFGAAIARENSFRFLADGMMPAILHEDPRYYRLGDGGTVPRVKYALVQAFVTHTDDGANTFNYGGFLGRGMGASLTYLYYPAPSRSGAVVLETFGASIGGLIVLDEFREFMPHAFFSRFDIFR
ncbi:MAG: hypothetical protein ACYDC6_06690 [Acidobacteriaceae bacterium]